jgi:hypothetical protein
MKSDFVSDVRNLEAQARLEVSNWRIQGEPRKRGVYSLPESIVPSNGAHGEWRRISRHIEIAVADGFPFFALVEQERVTDGVGRELRRSEHRIRTTSDQPFEIIRAGHFQIDTDRMNARLERAMDRAGSTGISLHDDPACLDLISEGMALSPAGRLRFKADVRSFAEGRIGAFELVRRTVERQDGYDAKASLRQSITARAGRTMGR